MDEKQGEYHPDSVRPVKDKSFQYSTRDKVQGIA